MKRLWITFLIFALLLTACSNRTEERRETTYELYYAARLEEGGGDAISQRSVRIADEEAQDTAAVAERLIGELLRTPGDLSILSPFPQGTELKSVSIAGGRATVDLTEQYERLSGVELSIADYCLTLTLTQLEGINAVRITANGRELPYRGTQLLTEADALLSGHEDALRPINVTLWFPDRETRELRPQQQTLALYEGQSRVSAVLDALALGPEGDDSMTQILPAGFAPLSSRIDSGICYVNLPADVPLPEDEAERALLFDALTRTLLSLNGVEEVQFLLEGEAAPEWGAANFTHQET